jgi:hypothetical protein
MAEGYRYTFQPYTGPASRFTCPSCGQRGKFTRYVDTATGEHLAEHVGRCNRQHRCGYHLKPREYFAAGGERPAGEWTPPPPPPELPGYRMSRSDVRATMGKPCNLLAYLTDVAGLDAEVVNATAWEYCVGGWPEPGKYHGAATFWQVDATGGVRSAKVVQYDTTTGKRRWEERAPGEWKPLATWAHALTGRKPEAEGTKLEQCLFGEHLLPKYPAAPVAIVEAEKTALVGRMLVPQVLWVAVGGLGELKLSKLLPLAGREAFLWPDLGKGHEEWSAKVHDLAPLFASLTVVDLLDQVATPSERESGLDLADYLLRLDRAAPVATASAPASAVDYTATTTAEVPEPPPAPALAPPPRRADRPGVVVVNTRGQYVKAWDRACVSKWTIDSREALVMSEADAMARLEDNRQWRGLTTNDKRIERQPFNVTDECPTP